MMMAVPETIGSTGRMKDVERSGHGLIESLSQRLIRMTKETCLLTFWIKHMSLLHIKFWERMHQSAFCGYRELKN